MNEVIKFVTENYEFDEDNATSCWTCRQYQMQGVGEERYRETYEDAFSIEDNDETLAAVTKKLKECLPDDEWDWIHMTR
jgi:hypothetical protein